MRITAIIPARGGSKGVPGKNIKLLQGYPLLAYSIAACKLSTRIERTIISTDSEQIASLAARYGAEVPFMRPADLARDSSPDIEFVLHAIRWMSEQEGRLPEFLVHIRPTTPLRDPMVIDQAIEHLENDPAATSLRSVQELGEAPEKYFRVGADGYLTGLFPNDPRPEYYNLPRQAFPPAYYPNGYVDVLRVSYVVEHQKMHGDRMIGFVTPRVTEVDTMDDFARLKMELAGCVHRLYDHLRDDFPPEKE